ncbi:adenylate/guanylate cyclase domain-containing protein [Candidatus Falkowbacteria bacterium]|nr:adenylate/guanylate cyclase domain-containing protein [Candidatus Falkowbacteria bacterium]
MLKKQTKILSAILTAVVCVGLMYGLLHFKVFNLFDEQLKDKLFVQEEISGQIVLIGIDDNSIQSFGEWPWSRSLHAQMIDKLSKSGVKAIGYDMTFSESSGGDNELLSVLQEGNKVVFPMEGELKLTLGADPQFTETLWPISEIQERSSVGHVSLITDQDGQIRRTPNFVKYQDEMVTPFFVGVLQKAGLWNEVDSLYPEKFDFDQFGLFRIKFFGPENTFQKYSFIDVYNQDFDSQVLQGKIVLVGATADNLHDQYFTASTKFEAMSGVEIQANLIESYLQSAYVQQVDNQILYLGLFILLGIISAFVAFAWRWYYSLLGMVLLIVLYLLGVVVAFVFSWLFSILYPCLLIILIFATAFVIRYLLESQEKQKIRAGFSQYVAKEVVDELIAKPEKLNLGGERRELTILFSDIRGFTSLSEKMKPEELVHYLNDYLTEMTTVIMDNNGVVDKFIGDAVMAFWNSPLHNENHRQDGLTSALLMQSELVKFNKKMKIRGMPEIKIGIGLNTGEVVVGNLGSHQRFDYTAIGDDVNLASRLESLTKYYGVGILASEKTKAELNNKFVFRYLDTVAVKGKQTGIKIYQVLGELADKKKYAELLEKFGLATQQYLNQEWPEALKSFSSLAEAYPEDRPIEIYVERLKEYLVNPPENFDGVFRANFK